MSDMNQIYDALLRIERNQGEMSADIRSIGSKIDKHIKDDDALHASVDRRVGSIEHKVTKVRGMVIGVSSFVSLVAGALTFLMHRGS